MPVCTKSVHHGWSEGACTWCEPEPVAVLDPKSVTLTLDGKPFKSWQPEIEAFGFGPEGVTLAIYEKEPALHEAFRLDENADLQRHLPYEEHQREMRRQELRYTVGIDYGFSPATVVLADGRVFRESIMQRLLPLLIALDGG